MLSVFSIANAAIDSASFGKVVDPIINHIVNPIIMLLFAIGMVVFVYGVFQMILHADDADARSTGRQSMLWGVIGMFIMVSAWGIINLIANTILDI